MPPIIEARGLTKHYGEVHALDGLDLVAESGRRHRPARAQRRRQDHLHQRRRHAAAARLGHAARGRHRRRRRPQGGAPGDRPRRAVRLGRAGHDRPGEPRDGRPPVRPRQAAAAKAPPARCSSSSASPTPATGSSATTRAACAAASTSAPASSADPRLLLLDEPTTGLDPRSRMELWDAIRTLVADGTDVLLTTQYLEEADQLARDVVIVDHGRVIASGTPDELKGQGGQRRHRGAPALAATTSTRSPRSWPRSPPSRPAIDHDTQRVSVRRSTAAPTSSSTVVRLLDERRLAVDDIGLRRPTLDEVFLALTGQPIESDTDPDATRRRGLRSDPP